MAKIVSVITDYAAENFVHVLWKYISSSGSSIYQNYNHQQLEYKKDENTLEERIEQIDILEQKEFQRIDQFEKLRQDLLRELKSKKVSK